MDFEYHFCVILILILISYLLGKVLLKSSNSIFSPILMGLIILVSIAALYFSHGKSILIGTIPILAFYFIGSRKETPLLDNKQFELTIFDWITHGVALVVLMLTFGYYSIPTVSHLAPQIYFDTQFYGDLAFSISHGTGERMPHLMNTFLPDSTGFSPYHWFDIWFIALVGNVTTIPYAIAFQTIYTPLLSFLVFAGAYELLLLKTKNKLVGYTLAFALAIMPVIYINWASYSPLLNAYTRATFGTYLKAKNFILTAILIHCWIHHIKNSKSLLPLLFLLLLPIVDIATAIAIICALGIVLIYKTYKKGVKFIIVEWALIGSFLFVALLLFVFYAIFKLHILSTACQSHHSNSLMDAIVFGSKYFLILCLSLFLSYIASVGILLVYHPKIKLKIEYTPPILLTIIFAISILLTSSLFYYTDDSYQFMNIALVMLNLSVVIYFGEFISEFQHKKLIFSSLLAIVFTHNLIRIRQTVTSTKSVATNYEYSNEFILAVKSKLASISNPIGVSVYNNSYGKINHTLLASFNCISLPIQCADNKFMTTNLSSYKMSCIPKAPFLNDPYVINNPYAQWKLQKVQSGAPEIRCDEISFIKEFKIEYGIFEDENSISDEFKSIIAYKTKDTLSGVIFVVFTNSNK